MWLLLAFLSAALLGFYDVFKKLSLRNNAVLPVLMINTVTCALFFLPLLVASALGVWNVIPAATPSAHLLVLFKAAIVLSSWVCGYFAIKHLPLTIVGPINATRPVMTLSGALFIYATFSAITVSILYPHKVILTFSSKIPLNSYFTADGVIMSPVETSMERGVTIVS